MINPHHASLVTIRQLGGIPDLMQAMSKCHQFVLRATGDEATMPLSKPASLHG
jgi:hypothetical protein